MADAGVAVQFTQEPGLIHGYLRARTLSKGARDPFKRITKALDAMVIQAANQ